jgi:hypothetical protein
LNLCRPDNNKSCAACCGLYNVPDATRPTLLRWLEHRTDLFRSTERSVDTITRFESLIRHQEPGEPLEPMIHVCRFAGFVDPANKVVGCMLHPLAPGNNGVDLRGLCHYGSMACKAFFCPAWQKLPKSYVEMVVRAVDDWHLYGLVINDVDFVLSVFSLIEERLGKPIKGNEAPSEAAVQALREILSWKDAWPHKDRTTLRRSRYYFKPTSRGESLSREEASKTVLRSFAFTFGSADESEQAQSLLSRGVERFALSWESSSDRP